ncbi:MAG TPA: DUF1269 domain-containing protein [Ktedonobacterales bacterium]|nr:DUF1269 domain-containing protein [Ktedonobacterales bacterium]
MPQHETASSEFSVMVFPRLKDATAFAHELIRLDRRHAITIHNLVVIHHPTHGAVTLHERNDLSGGQGAFLGGMIGTLAGLVGGQPIAGAIVGTVGGYLAGALIDVGFDDRALRAIGEALPRDGAAVAVVLTYHDLARALRRLGRYQGRLVQNTVTPIEAEQLLAAFQQQQHAVEALS